MIPSNDMTESGIILEGNYENDRNARNAPLYKKIIREVYGVHDVIIAHHLVYVSTEKRHDGFVYQIVQEIPSADTLIFDHNVAKHLFGDCFRSNLAALACEPADSRDALLQRMVDTKLNLPTPEQQMIAADLRAAETAHAEYEKTLGHRDENWADWYAEYIISHRNISLHHND